MLIVLWANTNGQSKLSLQQMKLKLDSVLTEADVLYRFEKAAWIASDSARSRITDRSLIGPYMVYQSNDSVRVVFLNRNLDVCIYEAVFLPFVDTPFAQKTITRSLSPVETKLFDVRRRIIEQITEQKYFVTCPEGYNLNLELIPFDGGYRFYLITGTGQSGIIPFGNDYLFVTDGNGKIKRWRKFHTRLITQPIEMDGKRVESMMHSHIRDEPFISASDICTFRLYGSFYGYDRFDVYSPALSATFTYKMATNTIEIDRKDSK
jgi:hypothetical protein